MKEGFVADEYRTMDEDEAASGGFTASAAFPALVALWFAALFGGGCLFLPPVLFDAVFGGPGPFGPHTRIVAALVAAGLGLVIGLFIAGRVRGGAGAHEEQVPASPPEPKRKRLGKGRRKTGRDARQPLDVRSALGLAPHDDDDADQDDDETAPAIGGSKHPDYALCDEAIADDVPALVRPPVDDPYFASAWAHSEGDSRAPDRPGRERAPIPVRETAGDTDWGPSPLPRPEDLQDRPAHVADRERDTTAQPTRAAEPAPSRYNPFADFVSGDDAPEEGFDPREEETAPYRAAQHAAPPPDDHHAPIAEPAPMRPFAPPPPPAWPMPRAQEPGLKDLGVAELVERLARALQGQDAQRPDADAESATPRRPTPIAPPRSGEYRHESALAPRRSQEPDVDRALRGALDRLARLDDVA